MTKVLLLVEPKTEQLQQLKSEFPTATFTTDPADCRDAEIILGWKADLAATILKNEQLQWIQAKSAGGGLFSITAAGRFGNYTYECFWVAFALYCRNSKRLSAD
nr:hypothetical protein [Liquorilactobacillus satsumensis]